MLSGKLNALSFDSNLDSPMDQVVMPDMHFRCYVSYFDHANCLPQVRNDGSVFSCLYMNKALVNMTFHNVMYL